eukprot:1184497-Prorocentrum_minimum.AAC.2
MSAGGGTVGGATRAALMVDSVGLAVGLAVAGGSAGGTGIGGRGGVVGGGGRGGGGKGGCGGIVGGASSLCGTGGVAGTAQGGGDACSTPGDDLAVVDSACGGVDTTLTGSFASNPSKAKMPGAKISSIKYSDTPATNNITSNMHQCAYLSQNPSKCAPREDLGGGMLSRGSCRIAMSYIELRFRLIPTDAAAAWYTSHREVGAPSELASSHFPGAKIGSNPAITRARTRLTPRDSDSMDLDSASWWQKVKYKTKQRATYQKGNARLAVQGAVPFPWCTSDRQFTLTK